jgi:hypothetical protein
MLAKCVVRSGRLLRRVTGVVVGHAVAIQGLLVGQEINDGRRPSWYAAASDAAAGTQLSACAPQRHHLVAFDASASQ